MGDIDLLLSLMGGQSPKPQAAAAPQVTSATPVTSINVGSSGRQQAAGEDVCGFTKLEIVNRKTAQAPLVASLRAQRLVMRPLSAVQNMNPTPESTLAVAAVLVEKRVSTTRKGGQYSYWRLSDLEGESVVLTLFDYAHSIHQKEAVGTVVVVARPQIDKQKTGGGKATLSIETVDQLTIIGSAKHFGYCMADRKDGTPCSIPVNRSLTNYCKYHISHALKKPVAPLQAALAKAETEQPRNSLESSTEFYAVPTTPAAPQRSDAITSTSTPTAPLASLPPPLRTPAATSSRNSTSGSSSSLSLRQVLADSQRRREVAAVGQRIVNTPAATRQAPPSITPPLKPQAASRPQPMVGTSMRTGTMNHDAPLAKRPENRDLLGELTSRKRKLPAAAAATAGSDTTRSNAKRLVGTTGDERWDGQVQVPQEAPIFQRPPPQRAAPIADGSFPLFPVRNAVPEDDELEVLPAMAPSATLLGSAVRPAQQGTTAEPAQRVKRIDYSVGFSMEKLAQSRVLARATGKAPLPQQQAGTATSRPAEKKQDAFDLFFGRPALTMEDVLKSSNEFEAQADHEWFSGFDKRAEQLAKREYAAEQAEKQKSMNVKAFYCQQCDNVQEFVLPFCKTQKHTIKTVSVLKRFFECATCKARRATLCQKLPTIACPGCGSDRWRPCGRGGSSHGANDPADQLILTSADLDSGAEMAALRAQIGRA